MAIGEKWGQGYKNIKITLKSYSFVKQAREMSICLMMTPSINTI